MNVEYLNKNSMRTKSDSSYEAITKAIVRD